MSNDNQHRVALVTGGMGGIGQAIAQVLHDAGHRVIVTHSPNNDHVDEWLAEQARDGRTFKTYGVDVADFDSCTRLAEQLATDGHAIDILINDSGITRDSTLRKMTKDNWDVVLRTNLDSMFNMTRPLIEGMVERGWGRIVNISSVNGSKGQFGQTNYSAAKAGIHGFTKSLAQEVARKGVTVNTVSPGYVATSMVAAMRQDALDAVVAQIPVGRLGQPGEIAALVGFICSEAAAYMTGANVAMNGGQHMY